MQRRKFLNALAAFAGAPAAARAMDARKLPVDLIVTGATFHTVDDAFPEPEALCVRGGTFAYVGSRDGAMALRGRRRRCSTSPGTRCCPA